MRTTSAGSLSLLLSMALLCSTASGFTTWQSSHGIASQHSKQASIHVTAATEDDAVNNNEDVLLYSSDWEDDDEQEEEEQQTPWRKNARWNSLSPKVKLRIMQESQERAIANKKKLEPARDKKRRKS